jgi:hypothetical protein
MNALLPTAQEIARALGGKRSGRGWSCLCPAHADSEPSLSVRDGRDKHGTVRPFLKCFSGCDYRDILDALRSMGIWPARGTEDTADEAEREKRQRARAEAYAKTEADAARKAERDLGKARRILLESIAPAPQHTIGKYLISREVPPPWPPCVRQHGKLVHYDPAKKEFSHWPAMVCPIRDIWSDAIIGVHRTWLEIGGTKAPVTHPKKVLGRLVGGAVKLSPDEDVEQGLGICEGIETGLCVLADGWAPIWALGAAGNLASFPVLPGVGSLTIFGDNDDEKTQVGERAAYETASRWRAAGRDVTVYIPKAPGVDWADEIGHR